MSSVPNINPSAIQTALLRACTVPPERQSRSIPGDNRKNATYQPLLPFTAATVDAVVEIVITTLTGELPGVTGAEGAKVHWLRLGNPLHASVTAPLKEEPTGWTVRL